MAFPKKKKKVESDILKWMREKREAEWEEALKKKTKSSYPTQEEKDKMKRLKEKYGIKEQGD